MQKYITFHIGEELFGIDVLRVQEINWSEESTITHIPKSPPYLKGILNLRGKIVPVIDLRRRFSMERSTWDLDTRVVITKFPDRLVGIVVDKVLSVSEIDEAKIEPLPVTVSGVDAGHVQGIYRFDDSIVTFLNIDNLVFETSDEEKRRYKRVQFKLPSDVSFSVQYKLSQGNWIDTNAMDISRGGVRILCVETLNRGEDIELKIVSKTGQSFYIKGRVMWSRVVDNFNNAGVMFLNSPKEVLALVGE